MIKSTIDLVPELPLTLAKSSQKYYGNLVIASVLGHLANNGDLEAWDVVDEIYVNNFM